MPDEVKPGNAATPAAPEKAQVDRSHKGEAAPAVTFTDPAGRPVTLAAFKGKPLLVNLWATWCAPCVAELPTLDKRAATAGDKPVVLAVSQDIGGAAKVLPFLAQRGVKALKPYTDSDMALSLAYKANLPTTILYDATGHEIWRVAGGMDWTGADADKLIAEAH